MSQISKKEKTVLTIAALIGGIMLVGGVIFGFYIDIGLGIITSILAIWGVIKAVRVVRIVHGNGW